MSIATGIRRLDTLSTRLNDRAYSNAGMSNHELLIIKAELEDIIEDMSLSYGDISK